MSQEMSLTNFLRRHPPRVEETVEWKPSGLRLKVSCYLGNELPPPDYVTSVRCLVLRDGAVLVVRDPTTLHILPGGRRERGESLEQTLQREVLAETGWRLTGISVLGFMHFRHLGPRPDGYRYPYPDFLQVVFMATAAEYEPAARETDGYEIESRFCSLAEVRALDLPSSQRLYLQAAHDSGMP